MKMRRRYATILAFVALASGCAATVKRGPADAPLAKIPPSAASKLVLNVSGSTNSVNAKDWNDFRQEWKENFAEKAGAARVKFDMQEGPSKPTGEDGVLLTVYVDDYRFIRPGTRYLTGIMGGNAYIEAKLTYLSLKTGQSFGSQAINTSSSAWEGVFSPMTNKQVEAIAVDVLSNIKTNSK